MELSASEIRQAVQNALAEDIGSGDVTTLATVPETVMARADMRAREPLVVAGLAFAETAFTELSTAVEIERLVRDGQPVQADEILLRLAGPARAILTAERVALNFVQRLSGIATFTAQFVAAIQGTRAQILDTRKTTPGLRLLEKRAAAAGGVTNHRMGLYDAILIKNNHIAAAGGVRAAMERARASSNLPIEIEVRTRAELAEALAAGAAHLLLDNLTPAQAAEWVREIAGRARVELSGGITLENVRAYAETGADFVSSGAITHSARAMDISFRLELA